MNFDTLPGSLGTANVYTPPNTPFYTGIVAHVDPERWTCTVEINQTGEVQPDIPVLSPYFYREKGQGAYFIPEVGAQCLVAETYGSYIILGFLPPVDVAQVNENITTLETENLMNDYSSGYQIGEPTTNVNLAKMSYRSNREGDMLQGDYCFKTRAGNKTKIFSNGNILLEATKLCTRIYSKLRNWIFDICVNWLFRTPGGEISWTNDDDTGDSNYKRQFKNRVDEDDPIYIEDIGKDAAHYKRTVQDGGSEVYSEHIAPDGTQTESMEGDLNQSVQGDMTETIQGDAHRSVGGTYTAESVGILKLESTTANVQLSTPVGNIFVSCVNGGLIIATAEGTWEMSGGRTRIYGLHDIEVYSENGDIDLIAPNGNVNIQP